MKILINSINYAPELIGIGKYTTEMAEWLTEAGHDVKVVTAPPYYPEWNVSKGYSAYKYSTGYINNVRVIRCPLWVPKSPSGLKRVLHLSSFSVSSFPVVLWISILWRPKIIFVVEPPLFCAPGVLVSGFISQSDTWLHIQDFEVDAAFDLGLLKSEWLRKCVNLIESWLMRRFDILTTISERMLKRLRMKTSIDKGVLFENWVETDKIFPMNHKPKIYKTLRISDEAKIILYSGNMGEKQGLEILIDAAERLKERKDTQFLLCGTGPAKKRLEQKAQNLNNVKFIPLQPLEKLNELLNLAYLHVLPQMSGAEDLVMPSKLTNMMASGKPVIATAMKNTQIANVLKDCGEVVNPGDLEGLCDSILRLVDDEVMAKKYGDNGRRYAISHWNIDNVMKSTFDNYLKS